MVINGIDGVTKASRIKGLYKIRTTNPTNPVTGETYFNNTSGKLFRYNSSNGLWWAWPYTSTSSSTSTTSSTSSSTTTTSSSTSTTTTTVSSTSTTL